MEMQFCYILVVTEPGQKFITCHYIKLTAKFYVVTEFHIIKKFRRYIKFNLIYWQNFFINKILSLKENTKNDLLGIKFPTYYAILCVIHASGGSAPCTPAPAESFFRFAH